MNLTRRRADMKMHYGVGIVAALVVAVGAGGVGATLVRSEFTSVTGTPTKTRVISEDASRSTTSASYVTLRSANVTVPDGERHTIVVRLTGLATCADSNPVANTVIPPRCWLRIRVGGVTATPDFFEFTGRGPLHAAAERGPLEAGTYSVQVQWLVAADNSRFSLPAGNLVEIEHIRVG